MASDPCVFWLLVVCIIGCAASTTASPTNETSDEDAVKIEGSSNEACTCDKLKNLETLLTEHFKDYRPVEIAVRVPKDCSQAYEEGWTKSGVYTISPDGSTKIDVYCEQELDGGGWTVFQSRSDGTEDFYRNWKEYKEGFGNLNGEFWLGNDNLYKLTKNKKQKLKIQLKDKDGEFAYADYSGFWIDDEDQKYKLHVSGFTEANLPGIGDSMKVQNEQPFTTKDQDNDDHPGHCAQMYKGAWWYENCHHSNLNGLFGSPNEGKGINWKTWKGLYESLRGCKMMLKTVPTY